VVILASSLLFAWVYVTVWEGLAVTTAGGEAEVNCSRPEGSPEEAALAALLAEEQAHQRRVLNRRQAYSAKLPRQQESYLFRPTWHDLPAPLTHHHLTPTLNSSLLQGLSFP
jgi:hypothetical protein